jgi:hypothetical protein
VGPEGQETLEKRVTISFDFEP